MERHGVRFQPSLSGTLSLSRTNAFFLGGGKALVNAYYNTAADLGVTILYEAKVSHITIENDTFESLRVTIDGKDLEIAGRAVVLASGGFQADLEWLARAWGPAPRTSSFAARPTIAAKCSRICSTPVPRASATPPMSRRRHRWPRPQI